MQDILIYLQIKKNKFYIEKASKTLQNDNLEVNCYIGGYNWNLS